MIKRVIGIAALFAAFNLSSLGAIRIRTVAFIGQAAPGTNGGIFSALGKPAINNQGNTAFRADLSGSSSRNGLFVSSGGSISAIVLSGNLGTNGAWYFTDFGDPSFNDVGQIAFMAYIGKGLRNDGIFLYSPPGLISIVLTGSVAPGTTGNFVELGQLALNNAGVIVFQGRFDGPQPGEGIFRYSNGTVAPVVLRSQLVSGPGTGRFSHFNGLALNNLGQIAFTASIAENSQSASGTFIADSNGIRSVSLEGQAAPYANGGFLGVSMHPSISDSGTVTFVDNTVVYGRFRSLSSAGIITSTPKGIAAIAGLATPRPSGGAIPIGNFFDPHVVSLSDGTDAALFAAWNGVKGKNALFVNSRGGMQEILGDAAPGGGFYSFISFSTFSSRGYFAFVSSIKGASTTGGLFAGTATF